MYLRASRISEPGRTNGVRTDLNKAPAFKIFQDCVLPVSSPALKHATSFFSFLYTQGNRSTTRFVDKNSNNPIRFHMAVFKITYEWRQSAVMPIQKAADRNIAKKMSGWVLSARIPMIKRTAERAKENMVINARRRYCPNISSSVLSDFLYILLREDLLRKRFPYHYAVFREKRKGQTAGVFKNARILLELKIN
jgi:hypothetical protein